MGIAQSALILLGIGIVSSRFKAGTGLGELGEGITSLVSAPLRGTGLGLSAAATGIRDIAETFGDLGRGLGELFKNIPQLPPGIPGNGNGQQLESLPIWAPKPLITNLTSDLDTGGGSRVPIVGISPAPSIIKQPVILPSVSFRPVSIRPPNPNIVML